MKVDEIIIKLCNERGYDPSQINNYYTLLEQLECIKALLETYPNQQYFTVKAYTYTASTKKFSFKISDVNNYGRQINVGDILIVTLTNNILEIAQISSLDTEAGTGVADDVGQLTGKNGADGAKGDKGDKGDGFNNLGSMVIATSNSVVSADDGFHVSINTQFKTIAGDLIASATGSYTLPIEGSQTVVCDIDETNHKVNIHLEAGYKNKIDRALQLPAQAPTAVQIPAVGTNNAQTMLGVGDGLAVEGGKLKVTNGSGARYLNILYMMFENNADTEHIRFEPNKVYCFFNYDSVNYQSQRDSGSFDFHNIKPMQWYGGDKPMLLRYTEELELYRPNYLYVGDEAEALFLSTLEKDNSVNLPDEQFAFQDYIALQYQEQSGNLTYFIKSIEVG